MMDKENHTEVNNGSSIPAVVDVSRASAASIASLEKDLGLPTCRVCHCSESDKRGDVALGFLGITPPTALSVRVDENPKPSGKDSLRSSEDVSHQLGGECKDDHVKFYRTEREDFVHSADAELGLSHHQHSLVELGCSCKNDLALVHYACALKWFINHGSTVCEICGYLAKNVSSIDFKRVLASLKDYETLGERTASTPPTIMLTHDDSAVDPDVVGSIRRQRLSEISSWFNPHNSSMRIHNNEDSIVLQMFVEQPSGIQRDNLVQTENPITKWAVEVTGILLSTGVLTITFAWLIAPRMGKTTKNGLHIILGGVCALAVVLFFRFVVLSRIRYWPARYWAILFIFWFLVFGIWASRTRGAHAD